MGDGKTRRLSAFEPRQAFYIGVDSDGCVFDTMELKQKQCFTPQIIQHFGLEALAGIARETTEFVNLYSRFRGQNRFKALVKTFDLLGGRSVVVASRLPLPDLSALRGWVERAPALDNASLEEEAVLSADPNLWRVLEWSESVNREVAVRAEEVFPSPALARVWLRLASGRTWWWCRKRRPKRSSVSGRRMAWPTCPS